MASFKPRKCICGFDTADAEIEPNPAGAFFCPRCGRDLIPVGPTEPVTEPGSEA